MDFYERALELKEETIENRRYIHEHAEIFRKQRNM